MLVDAMFGSKRFRKTVVRYWRSLRSFWGAALAAEMEYQINLLIELLATGGNLAGSLFVLSLFYRSGHGLGGWSWEEALVVLGMYTVLDGIASTLLQPNLSTIVGHVQNGSLDYVLLKPIDSQFWLSLRTFSPWGLPGIVLGLVLVVVGGYRQEPSGRLEERYGIGVAVLTG